MFPLPEEPSPEDNNFPDFSQNDDVNFEPLFYKRNELDLGKITCYFFKTIPDYLPPLNENYIAPEIKAKSSSLDAEISASSSDAETKSLCVKAISRLNNEKITVEDMFGKI